MRKLLTTLYVALFQYSHLTKARTLQATLWSNVLRTDSANYFLLVELYFHKKTQSKGYSIPCQTPKMKLFTTISSHKTLS